MERIEMESRNQYLEVLRERYLRAKVRKENGRILDEYCRNTGQARKYFIRKIQPGINLRPKPRRYRQPGEKDGDSMTSFVMESFANIDGRGFHEQRYTARSWRRLLQGLVVEIDNKVPWAYY